MLINNSHLFLTVLKAGKSKTNVPADSVYGESLLPGSQTAVLLMYHHRVKVVRELSGVSCIRVLIPFLRIPPS